MEQERYLYWMRETGNRKWNPIYDTEERRKLAIKSGAMFFTSISFSDLFSNNGQPEPTRYGDLPLDFDCKENPDKALQDMKHLCLHHLPELYDVDPYDIKFFCSGSKGFHAVIPKELFSLEDGDPYLPLIYKRIVADWAARFDLKTADHTMYAMGKGKMFRIENVKRKNGRYKVPLTLEEVRDLSIKELWKLSEAPRNV